jgi:hypothetical protein
VNRYYCEFCKKSGGHAGHIKDHEKYCTMNPQRSCRMCDIVNDFPQPNLDDLLAILPDPKKFEIENDPLGTFYLINFEPEVNAAVKKIRELTSCPACIMAALRQKGIPVPCANPEFDYKKESEEVFYQHNQDQLEKGYY